MEAIKAIAKRMKTRRYKIDLPFDTNAAAIRVMLIVEIDKKSIAEFAGKMKTDIDWLAYQNKIRHEWS